MSLTDRSPDFDMIGLPCPSFAEAADLFCLDGTSPDVTNIQFVQGIAHHVIHIRPDIQKAIDHDVDHLVDIEDPSRFLKSEVRTFKWGVQTGYEVVTGGFAHVLAMRNNYQDTNAFINDIAAHPTKLPLPDSQTLRYVTQFRAGAGAFDPYKGVVEKFNRDEPLEDEVVTSADVARTLCVRYLIENPPMEDVIDSWHLVTEDDDQDAIFNQGLWHGARNALNMHALSYEYSVLQHLTQSYAKKS